MDGSSPIPLSELAVGETARLAHADVDASLARLLRALGLTATSEFRLCKAGEPCILQVRSTRIGLSRGVAGRLLVVPTAAAAVRP